MAEEKKFNPAPPDKHADDPKQARKTDKEMHDALDKGLEGTFPGVRSGKQHTTSEVQTGRRSVGREALIAERCPDRASPASRIERVSWISLLDRPTSAVVAFPAFRLGTPGPLRSVSPLLATSPRSCAASYSSARRRFAAASRHSRRRQRQS